LDALDLGPVHPIDITLPQPSGPGGAPNPGANQ